MLNNALAMQILLKCDCECLLFIFYINIYEYVEYVLPVAVGFVNTTHSIRCDVSMFSLFVVFVVLSYGNGQQMANLVSLG